MVARDKKKRNRRAGYGLIIASVILLPLAAFGIISGVIGLILTAATTSPTTNLFRLVGILSWGVSSVFWIRNLRMGRMRLRGWVSFRMAGRKQYNYANMDSANFAPDAWQIFFNKLAADMYRVRDAAGTLVSRQVLADELNTHVGLVNDLYPLDVNTEIAHMMRYLTTATLGSKDERRKLRKSLRALYRAGGWIPPLRMYMNFDDTHKSLEKLRSDSYEECYLSLCNNLRLNNSQVRNVVDDLIYVHMMVNSTVMANELTVKDRAFGPSEFYRLLPKWQAAYHEVFQPPATS